MTGEMIPIERANAETLGHVFVAARIAPVPQVTLAIKSPRVDEAKVNLTSDEARRVSEALMRAADETSTSKQTGTVHLDVTAEDISPAGHQR